MDELRQLIHLLKSAVGRSSESPPGNINVQRRLYINSPIADAKPCTREQAAMLYKSLDGFQQQIAKLSSVKDDEQLADWFAGFNGWTEKNWGPVYANMCDGTSFFTRALRATAMWAVLSRITGIKGEISADAMTEFLSKLADYDLSAMYEDISPHIRLQINRIVRDQPLCSETRTEAFYATIDSFEEQSRILLDVDSNESLVDWVFAFHQWREDTWEEFYNNPCGLSLEHIYYLESRIYLATCMQYNEYTSGAAKVMNRAIAEWRSQADDDLAIIAGLANE
ncbi:MAG: hypothetical protein OXG53_11180 [Chloroflexi bacterium]|nr:hypothetical protein [Chloroflexota bacterium]